MSTQVSLFIPCLVDQFYPEIGIALVAILERLGYAANYNAEGVCCGQPAFNAGELDAARPVAKKLLDSLSGCEDIVCPSGSCTAMLRNFYGQLFAGFKEESRALEVGARVFELSEFLAKEGLIEKLSGSYSGKVAFHNSCHSLRELGVGDAIPKIFSRIQGCEYVSVQTPAVCCGFGGLFSVKFSPIAQGMAKTRLEMLCEAGADVIISNDPGCIMHMRQEAARLNIKTPIQHLAVFLARAMGLSAELTEEVA